MIDLLVWGAIQAVPTAIQAFSEPSYSTKSNDFLLDKLVDSLVETVVEKTIASVGNKINNKVNDTIDNGLTSLKNVTGFSLPNLDSITKGITEFSSTDSLAGLSDLKETMLQKVNEMNVTVINKDELVQMKLELESLRKEVAELKK